MGMSRLESGVLGNALEGVPEGGDIVGDSQFEDPEKMTAEEKLEVDSKVKEALDFNYQTCEVEWEKAEAAALEAESMVDEEASQEGDDESMEEDSAPVAEDKKIELGRRICEIFLPLGEVSLENENYDQ